MRKYIFALLVFLMSVVFIILVTEYEFESLDSLMKPPMVEGENREIQLAFEKFTGGNYKLITPLKGKYRSAYTFVNLNNDDTDEVIVFYSDKEENDLVRMNVLGKNTLGEWMSLADIETNHSDVEQIEFADINGDKIKELIVGWTVFQNEYAKSMNVYRTTFSEGFYAFESIYNSAYYDFRVLDVNCDGQKDILKIDYSKKLDKNEFKAVMLGYTDNEIKEATSVNLDFSFSSVISVTSEYLSNENRRRIYIDGVKHESGLLTDCIYFDSKTGELKKEASGRPALSVRSSRISNIVSDDINNDGLVEIPFEEELLGSEVIYDDNMQNKTQLIIKWKHINSNDTLCAEILNPVYSYSFRIEKDMINRFTVVNDLENGKLTFYTLKYGSYGFTKGEKLFEIIALPSAEFTDEPDYRYKLLAESHGYIYYCRIYEIGEENGYTRSFMKKNLILD